MEAAITEPKHWLICIQILRGFVAYLHSLTDHFTDNCTKNQKQKHIRDEEDPRQFWWKCKKINKIKPMQTAVNWQKCSETILLFESHEYIEEKKILSISKID